jgi:hypothetical protein
MIRIMFDEDARGWMFGVDKKMAFGFGTLFLMWN